MPIHIFQKARRFVVIIWDRIIGVRTIGLGVNGVSTCFSVSSVIRKRSVGGNGGTDGGECWKELLEFWWFIEVISENWF